LSVVQLHNNTSAPPSWSTASPFLNFRTVTSEGFPYANKQTTNAISFSCKIRIFFAYSIIA